MEKWNDLKIPFADIKDATKDFSKKIGEGGYGPVYEGELLINGECMKVAVKRLNSKHGQGLKEFLTEIDLLSGQRHDNLITLVGFCNEENEKIIVYEYADRGSLDGYLKYGNEKCTLTWLERLKIVVDAAKGLDHLHNHLPNNQVIIHRDIKTSNILIDDNWVAKLSDFGLSKSTFSGLGRSTVISYACGTPGYVEPELQQSWMGTRAIDVYSFGIVLFEVLCGRLCNVKYGDDIILSAEVAKKYYAEGILYKIIDPVIRERQISPKSFIKYSTIAYKCLEPRRWRPSIDVVKKALEESLKFQQQVSPSLPTHSISKTEWNSLQIPFAKIKDATKDFTNVIHKGDYSFVYEGELLVHGRYMKVLVKRSYEEFGQGLYQFLSEIHFLWKVAQEYYANGDLDKIIDPSLRKHMNSESLSKLSSIAYKCLHDRPLIVDVIKELEETLKIEMEHEESERLKSLSISYEEDISDEKSL
ncbi:hypothetical protein M8C21_009036 [Ambrosia artemisiifolia]|uniref:Protein kinase domain-containing protein n=1 Tax=Ambrosia artemisiifolia TaxID=4212 RepID=A0AAD5C974_AMBAR|nr:hypothetical protein M8C21_009036 [Ambrosia artemisiifolia]